jgi:7-carboxy-7-deazaguanine synthase
MYVIVKNVLRISVRNLVEFLCTTGNIDRRSTGITDVTLTGGEPLLQKDIKSLIEMLVSNGHRVEIETNGAHPIDVLAASECRPVFTLDYKLPSSGMERFMLTDN